MEATRIENLGLGALVAAARGRGRAEASSDAEKKDDLSATLCWGRRSPAALCVGAKMEEPDFGFSLMIGGDCICSTAIIDLYANGYKL